MAVEQLQQEELIDSFGIEAAAMDDDDMEAGLDKVTGALQMQQALNHNTELLSKYINMKLDDKSISYEDIQKILKEDGPKALSRKRFKVPKNPTEKDLILDSYYNKLDDSERNMLASISRTIAQMKNVYNALQHTNVVLKGGETAPAVNAYENFVKTMNRYGVENMPANLPFVPGSNNDTVINIVNDMRKIMFHDLYINVPSEERDMLYQGLANGSDQVTAFILFGTGELDGYRQQTVINPQTRSAYKKISESAENKYKKIMEWESKKGKE